MILISGYHMNVVGAAGIKKLVTIERKNLGIDNIKHPLQYGVLYIYAYLALRMITIPEPPAPPAPPPPPVLASAELPASAPPPAPPAPSAFDE